MDLSTLQPYVLPSLLVGLFGWRQLKFRRVRSRLPWLLSQGAALIDVRSAGEYSGGAAPGSINIPLNELEKKADQLDRDKPVVVCCASGTRSAMAASVLRRKGFKNVVNAGPWRNAVVRA